jgi:hypothetical protein
MPPSEDIQRQLLGAWQMMLGKRDGIRLLDLSVDGFWNSFFAIIVALPVLVVGWVPLANDAYGVGSSLGERLSFILRLAIVDISVWVLPLAALAIVAGFIGVKDRFVPYVVATNWGSALFAWFMLPASLLTLIFPDAADLSVTLSLLIFLGTLVLSWRLTNSALGKGPIVATGVFIGTLFFAILVLFLLQDLLGIAQV